MVHARCRIEQALNGDSGIAISFNPASGNGDFSPRIVAGVDSSVPAGLYTYEIKINCHGMIRVVDFSIYVGICPAENSGQRVGVSGEDPFPEECTIEEETPTPTPSPTASPTEPPQGLQTVWGNNNCSGANNMAQPDPVDSLFVLRGDAGLSADTGDCPGMGTDIEVLLASPHIWGDVDCLNGMSPVDSLKILRFDAGLSVAQADGCPLLGSEVTVIEA